MGEIARETKSKASETLRRVSRGRQAWRGMSGAIAGCAIALGLGLVSCGERSQLFTVQGKVHGAEGQMLYLEEVGTSNVLALDSVELGADGRFSFSHKTMPYPMFYCLRLGESTIPFAADSLTTLRIETKGGQFFESYKILEGQEFNHQIREISHLRFGVDRQIDSVLQSFQAGNVTRMEAIQSIQALSEELKSKLTMRYIYVEPASPSAYIALFQRKSGDQESYLSADVSGDSRAFAAVATAYDTYYPEAPYTPFLKDLALRAVANARTGRQQIVHLDSLDAPVEYITFPEIKLSDASGRAHSLTQLAKDTPVLLSFTAYSAEWSPQYVADLRALHERRPDLKIFEVSSDKDTYLWRNAVRTLPWVCVHEPGVESLGAYNVQSLPSLFYIHGGEVRRITDLGEL